MGAVELQERFAQVQERVGQDRRRRRGAAVGGGLVAAAAAALAAVAVVGGLPWQDDPAQLAVGERERAVLGEPLVGSGRPADSGPFTVDAPVAFTVEVPDKGEVPGTWHYETADERFSLGLDSSPSTGFANVVVAAPTQVYDPALAAQGGTGLVPAPADADAWVAWFEQSGVVEVTGRKDVDVAGVPATRLSLDVSDELAPASFPCAPGESCLPLAPDGPSVVASSRTGETLSELTVLEVDGRTVLAVALGDEETRDQWLPLLHEVVESLRFP